MKITRLKATQDGNRVNVYLDGEYSLTISYVHVGEFSLFVGKEITEEVVNDLKISGFETKLKYMALAKLSRGLCSKFQLEQYLRRKAKLDLTKSEIKGLEDVSGIVSRISDGLERDGYIDDLRFARAMYDIKIHKKSFKEIKVLLLQKGIANNVIDQVFQERDVGEAKQDDLIDKLIDKKYRTLQLKHAEIYTLKQKIIQTLMRKGFDFRTARERVDTYFNNISA